MLARLSVVKIWSSSRYTKSLFAALQAIQRDSARPCLSQRPTVSFLLSIGAKSAFVSSQTGDSIRTLETHYVRYLPGADTGRKIVATSIRHSETLGEHRQIALDSDPATTEKALERSRA
jgi:hypothetical protein